MSMGTVSRVRPLNYTMTSNPLPTAPFILISSSYYAHLRSYGKDANHDSPTPQRHAPRSRSLLGHDAESSALPIIGFTRRMHRRVFIALDSTVMLIMPLCQPLPAQQTRTSASMWNAPTAVVTNPSNYLFVNCAVALCRGVPTIQSINREKGSLASGLPV